MMDRLFWFVIVVAVCAQRTVAVETQDDGHQTEHAHKKTIELQTAYVYRKASERVPHYSVILGSSGKSVLGPALVGPGQDEIHRVQGFVLNNDDVQQGDTSRFAKAAIFAHNRYRMLHHSPPLTWSDTLAKQAQSLAYKMAKDQTTIDKRTLAGKTSYFKRVSIAALGEGRSEHGQKSVSSAGKVASGDSKRTVVDKASNEDMDTLGENIERLFSVRYGCDSSAALEVVGKWYDESKKYSYAYPHVDEKTSSYTQLVWKDSKVVGAGCAIRKGLLTNDVFVVALYSPPGNSEGGLTSNVLRAGKETHKDDVYSNIFR